MIEGRPGHASDLGMALLETPGTGNDGHHAPCRRIARHRAILWAARASFRLTWPRRGLHRCARKSGCAPLRRTSWRSEPPHGHPVLRQGVVEDVRAHLDWLLGECSSDADSDFDALIEPMVLELMALRLTTPPQFVEHLDRGFEAGFRTGQNRVATETVATTPK